MPAPGKRMPRGMKPTVDNPGKVIMRLVRYIFQYYRFRMIIVFTAILISVIANLRGTMFMQVLIDDYIVPLVKAHISGKTVSFAGLLHAMGIMAVWYGVGIAATYAYNRIMVNVTQGTLLHLRKELFNHMESLPLKYFDSHSHGDIMSVYTNQ